METKRKSARVAVSLLALAGLLVFSLFAVGGSLEPSAPPGPTMKTLDEVEPRVPIHASDLPLTITEPNSYYLAEDVNFTDDTNHAITIECNDVTIDLMGFTLKGPDSGTKYGIYIKGRTNVEVRNGTVRDFYFGIHEVSPPGGQHRIINVRATSNQFGGIYIYGTRNADLVKDCTAAENGSGGISAGSGSTVTGNISYNNGGRGIFASTASTVTGNTCYNNGSEGIVAGVSSTVTGNTARDNGDDGINASSVSTVIGNTCYNNGNFGDTESYGIYVGDGSTVTGNTCNSNYNGGIYVDSGCTVTGNTAYYNSSDGIRASSSCTVTGNTASYNGGDGISCTEHNRITDNMCDYNGHVGGNGAGIHATGTSNRIERNNVTSNDRGIDADSANNLIVKNSAAGNTTEYDIVGGNKVGTISTDPTTAGPWDNFDF